MAPALAGLPINFARQGNFERAGGIGGDDLVSGEERLECKRERQKWMFYCR